MDTEMEQTLPLRVFKDAEYSEYDALVVLGLKSPDLPTDAVYSKFGSIVDQVRENDDALEKEGGFILLPKGQSIRRLIYSPVGPISRDFDDIRRFRDAAYRGVKRALKAGATKPLIYLPSSGTASQSYSLYDVVSVLGAYEAIYTPLEIREAFPGSLKTKYLSFCNFDGEQREKDVYRLAEAIERGCNVAKDIGGSDPERMSAINTAAYVKEIFANSVIKVDIMDNIDQINKEFPMLGIVNRGNIPRHEARVIFLSYEPNGGTPVDTTLVLVGKGVTYDTGGHDIKAGGIMAGMHRDKCGAAAIAGFFQTLNILKPKGLRVFGALAMVRNSIGPDAYVADELITSRAGVRVRIGNTDAEGRMAMVDLLCYYKEKVLRDSHPNPHFFTIATLTGHACLAAGDFSIIMDNGPARLLNTSRKIQEAGDKVGDIFELSSIRREDYEFNKGKSEYEDVLQCNNLPSSRTPRGHQVPAAFLLVVSGLDKNGLDSERPLPYSHIDIAASSGPFPGIPTGAPIPALAVNYLLSR
ncbi:putative aminopeptidase W07G4.4 [Halotydeus destructor]|nr:putative aminopeptidase W07G4.4 [Halotydeus destructor]